MGWAAVVADCRKRVDVYDANRKHAKPDAADAGTPEAKAQASSALSTKTSPTFTACLAAASRFLSAGVTASITDTAANAAALPNSAKTGSVASRDVAPAA